MDLVSAARTGVDLVKAGHAVLIDARNKPGYSDAMPKGMTGTGKT
jgi:hypothetical protein